MQPVVFCVSVVGLAATAVLAGQAVGLERSLAVFIGALGGLALYHAAFGFTGAWRRLQREGRGRGVRAQLLLLGMVVVVSYPLIAYGAQVGLQTRPWVSELSAAAAFGAAVFGLGMQLGGGCGSGVLFTVGGGSTRMVLTLGGFLAGSVLWTGTHDLWRGGPSFGRASMIVEVGAPLALFATLAALAALYLCCAAYERRRCGDLESWRTPKSHLGRETPAGWRAKLAALVYGPWSLPLGAAVLAAVVVLTFLTLGRPWGITAAYPIWGVKLLDTLYVPIGDWNGWSQQRIDRPIFADATSVMNFGVMLGALAGAGLAGRFAPTLKISARDVATAVIGGVLMGYGARLASGCNIGGFIGGVASGSLHGWWWLLFGALGSIVGVRLRSLIGMDPPISAANEGARI